MVRDQNTSMTENYSIKNEIQEDEEGYDYFKSSQLVNAPTDWVHTNSSKGITTSYDNSSYKYIHNLSYFDEQNNDVAENDIPTIGSFKSYESNTMYNNPKVSTTSVNKKLSLSSTYDTDAKSFDAVGTNSVVTKSDSCSVSSMYTSVRKLQQIHYEEPSDLWSPRASNVKFVWHSLENTEKPLHCRIIHGKSTLGGSLIRIVSWEDRNRVLYSFDQRDVIGAKLRPPRSSFSRDSSSSSSNDRRQSRRRSSLSRRSSSLSRRRSSLSRRRSSASVIEGSSISFASFDHFENFSLESCSEAGSELFIFSYPRKDLKCPNSRVERRAKHIVLELAETCSDVTRCEQSLNALASPFHSSRRRCLVVVGSQCVKTHKKSRETFESSVRKMLNEANIDYDVFETFYQYHAYDRIKERTRSNTIGVMGRRSGEQLDVSKYDAVIVIGGDNTFIEVVQGVMARKDELWIRRKTSFAVIPTGIGDGIAETILHMCKEHHGPLEASFLVCKGENRLMDMSVYEFELEPSRSVIGNCIRPSKSRQPEPTLMVSLAVFTWGTCKQLKDKHIGPCSDLLRAQRKLLQTELLYSKAKKIRLSLLPVSRLSDLSEGVPSMPILSQPVPSNWDQFETECFFFCACQISHLSRTFQVSTDAQLDDGIFQLFLFKKPTSKFEALKHMKKIGKGEHESSDLCQTFSCVAYRLFHYNEAQYGDIDTTSIKYTSIQAHIIPCAINVYGGKPFSGCLL